MRVLFIVESLRSGGKERRLIELLKGLNDNDVEIALILSRNEIYYKEIFELNVSLNILDREIGKKDIKPFFQIYSIAKKFQPDIIHSWGNMMSIYSIPSRILLKKPLINNQIVDAPNKVSNSFLSYKLTFPFSDLIIANSNAGLKAYSAPLHKSITIYNGFDFIRIKDLKASEDVRREFNIKTDLVVGMVASFSKLKDYKTFVKAAIIILKENKNVTFLCVGSGDKAEYIKMVPEEFSDYILFLDVQDDILSIMNVCDVGVLSTFTEGISNAIMEFMALSKPVVATDGGGTKELVLNDITGYLVSAQSEQGLANRITKLLNNSSLRSKFGEQGKNRIEEDFNIKRMTEKYYSEYIKTIS